MIEEMFQEAKLRFSRGDYKSAEPLLFELLLKAPQNPEVHQMLASIQYMQGQYQKAIRSFKRALEIDPNYTDASVGLSILYNDLGKYEEGASVFLDARQMLDLRLTTDDANIEEAIASKHEELADLYCKIKMFEDANRELEKALKISKRKAEISLRIIQILGAQKKSEIAISRCQALLKDYPRFVTARLTLASLLASEGQVSSAQTQIDLVLRTDPQNKEALKISRNLQNQSETRIERNYL